MKKKESIIIADGTGGGANGFVENETHKEKIHFDIEKNAIKDMGNGKVMFSTPVTITDNSEMWSGARYDISSMDLSGYRGKLTADHMDRLETVIGKVIGLKKVQNRRVTIDGVDFAVKENPLADYAKRMMMAGYLTDFSIETVGPWPNDEGVFENAKMVGLSLVVTGNNKQAHINQIALETLEDAKKNGLDTALFAQSLNLPIDNNSGDRNNESMKSKKVKKVITKEVTPQDNSVNIADIIKNAVAEATKPLHDKIVELETTVFDNAAKEPEFKKVSTNKIVSDLSSMSYEERHSLQINHAWDMLKGGNMEASKKLIDINKFHLEALKEAGKVKNSMTISDFGNFVISPELLTDIEGFRSNFNPLLAKVSFKDTLSLQMAWLTRDGDINMQEVEFCDDEEDGNLKPISEYGATISTSNLHELAAVTPVCNAATRFLAADLLGDVAQGYRLDFDRKKAQLLIARLQQAVNTTGNVAHYNTASSGGASENALRSFFAVGGMQEEIMNGTYIMSQASFWELGGRKFEVGVNVDDGFSIFSKGPNGETMLLGAPVVVVPNELLPKLGSNQTRTFVVEGVSVVITTAVFYADLSTFSGRTSGGLMYDLSTEAAYEDNGTVKSAFQRNELVLRGSFFRGGAVRDPQKVVGLEAVNLS